MSNDPWADFAEEQISNPVKARMRAAKTRAERKMAKQMSDAQIQFKLWKEWHAKRRDQLMAGRYRAEAKELADFLETTTLESGQNILSFIARGPWHDADGDTRFLVLGLVSSRIMMLRTQEGLSPFNDSIPFSDEPPTCFEIIRAMLSEKGEI
jgi:hypothetical protein